MTQILTNGIKTHVLRMPTKGVPDADGQPPSVVLVHGFGATSLASFYFTLVAPMSARGIDVIAYDLRGHGRSSRPPTGYRQSDLVADLSDLLDALDVPGPVHLVGNSYGGTVAFSYTVAHPERVASLALIEAEPATELWSRKMCTLGDKFRQLEYSEKLDLVTATRRPHILRLAKTTMHKLQTTTMGRDTLSGPLLSHEQIQTVRCPIIMILGGESDIVDQSELVSLLPHCHTVVVPEQPHLVLMYAPGAVLDLLLPWIAEQHSAHRSQAGVGRA